MNKHQLASKRRETITVFLSRGYAVWKTGCILSPKGVSFLLSEKKKKKAVQIL